MELAKNIMIYEDIAPQNATTDAVSGGGFSYDGWNDAYYILNVGAPTDSDDTIAFLIQSQTTTNVVSDAAASDYSNLSTDTLSVTFGTSAAPGGPYVGRVDLIKHGLTSGTLRGQATLTGEGDSAPIALTWILTKRTGHLPIASDFTQTYKEWTT